MRPLPVPGFGSHVFFLNNCSCWAPRMRYASQFFVPKISYPQNDLREAENYRCFPIEKAKNGSLFFVTWTFEVHFFLVNRSPNCIVTVDHDHSTMFCGTNFSVWYIFTFAHEWLWHLNDYLESKVGERSFGITSAVSITSELMCLMYRMRCLEDSVCKKLLCKKDCWRFSAYGWLTTAWTMPMFR